MAPTPGSLEHPRFDDDGLLIDTDLWSEQLAETIARECDIAMLTSDHWEVIRALRSHYARFGVAPPMSQVCQRSQRAPHWVHHLFHTCLNAWRVAGLPNPGEEQKTYLNDA